MIAKLILALTFMSILFTVLIPAQANEPTWLFTVPKAQSMGKDVFSIGFVYADLGITENLELGIHGVKYSLPDSALALGISLFPMASPYVVFSPGSEDLKLHLGIKAAPYIFFGALEAPLARKVKLAVELNNGLTAGIRILLNENWTLDILGAFASVEVYKYNYKRIDFEDFHIVPGILFAYTSRL